MTIEREMKAITPATREQITRILEKLVDAVVRKQKGSKVPPFETASQYLELKSEDSRLKPFHYALIPEINLQGGAILQPMQLSEFERGLSTRLGNSFEECARLIALDHHRESRRGCTLRAEVSAAAVNELERQVAFFDSAAKEGEPRSPFGQMIQSVLNARQENDLKELVVKVDLYILTKDGKELYFEIKSPKPNKGQCIEVTQRLLRFHLLRGKPQPEVFAHYAMAYNPYGKLRSDYSYGIAMNYTPFEEVVLIGHEFWDMVGGPTTLEELLGVFHEVGIAKNKDIIDSFTFEF
jgi:hypothetical protein